MCINYWSGSISAFESIKVQWSCKVVDPYPTLEIAPSIIVNFITDADSIFNPMYELFEAKSNRELQLGGSRLGRSPNIARSRVAGATQLHPDYRSVNPTDPLHSFEHRYCIFCHLFFNIFCSWSSVMNSFRRRKTLSALSDAMSIRRL